jgi:hypothetical protein
MLTFDFEEPKESVCDCCGNTIVRLTRFVREDGDAHAIYYAMFTKGHSEKKLSGLISLGEWGEDASPENRVAFPFQIWTEEENFKVGLVDAEDSPWSHVTFLGRILNRDEALKHEWLTEVFHITDHMVTDDFQITSFFESDNTEQ